MRARLTPKEVAERLGVGPKAVYALLEQGILPGIRVGKRWLITRNAYEEWERTCGMRTASETMALTGLKAEPEVTVN